MRRGVQIVVILILVIAQREFALAKPASEPPARSRLVAAILEQFAGGYRTVCFIGSKSSKTLRPRRFDLPPEFYDLFVTGQLDGIEVNALGCPTPARDVDACQWGCVVFVVFDFTAFGHPTPWQPWPGCNQEIVAFSSSYRSGPEGRLVLAANVYRGGMHYQGSRSSLTIVELAPCKYNIHDQRVIE
jgi:hypothetical protein